MAAAIYGVLMGAVAILGLFLAAGARDGAIHVAGLLLFLFGLATIFVLIHRLTGPGGSGR